jgi:hypothetical protein
MKKFIAIVAVAVSLTACNSGSKTETTTNDSTVIKADTTLVVDSTTVDSVKKAK